MHLIRDDLLREACGSLCELIDDMFQKPSNSFDDLRRKLRESVMRTMEGGYSYDEFYSMERQNLPYRR
jgi:hypothetical protein